MNWTPPPVAHLLEQRLQTARLELMEDQRLLAALRQESRETLGFILELIEKKIAAAAHAGIEAVEASLRADAAESLLAEGHDADAVRAHLKVAGERLRSVEQGAPFLSASLVHQPTVVAASAFGLWTIGALGLWAGFQLPVWACVLLVGLGAAPAWGFYTYSATHAAILKKTAVSEYPARLCRHYLRALEDGVARYEEAVHTFEARPVPTG